MKIDYARTVNSHIQIISRVLNQRARLAHAWFLISIQDYSKSVRASNASSAKFIKLLSCLWLYANQWRTLFNAWHRRDLRDGVLTFAVLIWIGLVQYAECSRQAGSFSIGHFGIFCRNPDGGQTDRATIEPKPQADTSLLTAGSDTELGCSNRTKILPVHLTSSATHPLGDSSACTHVARLSRSIR